MKIPLTMMTHDLACALSELGSADRERDRGDREVTQRAAVVRVSTGSGRDPAEMRAIEGELLAVVTGDVARVDGRSNANGARDAFREADVRGESK